MVLGLFLGFFERVDFNPALVAWFFGAGLGDLGGEAKNAGIHRVTTERTWLVNNKSKKYRVKTVKTSQNQPQQISTCIIMYLEK
jgi:hypothetical protein